MDTTTTVPAPVKGMVFKHARRTDWQGNPLVCTVTSVTPEKVFWQHPLYNDRRFKTPVAIWEKMVLEVVSVPEASISAPPKMTKRQCADLFAVAHAAGLAAGGAHDPTPMMVFEHENPLDDTSPVERVYAPVMDGVCGFAWVTIRPGSSDFARWCRKNVGSHKGYYGGEVVWVGDFGQSMERKMAYATAFAKVLSEAGIRAYPASRMD